MTVATEPWTNQVSDAMVACLSRINADDRTWFSSKKPVVKDEWGSSDVIGVRPAILVEITEFQLEPFLGKVSYGTQFNFRITILTENPEEPQKEAQRLLWDVIRAITDDYGLTTELGTAFPGYALPSSGTCEAEFADGRSGLGKCELTVPVVFRWAQGSPGG